MNKKILVTFPNDGVTAVMDIFIPNNEDPDRYINRKLLDILYFKVYEGMTWRYTNRVNPSKALPAKIGRPKLTKENLPKAFCKHFAAYEAGIESVTDLARICGVSRPTIYKWIRIMEK